MARRTGGRGESDGEMTRRGMLFEDSSHVGFQRPWTARHEAGAGRRRRCASSGSGRRTIGSALARTDPTGETRKGANPTSQDWTLDLAGNWAQFDVTGSPSLRQRRTPGPGDRIQSITNYGPGEVAWSAPRYDEAGNMIAMPQTIAPQFGLRATYDAWNRPTRITWSNSAQEVQFRYDGLGRMVFRRELDAGGFISEDRHYAWSHDWRLLEEHVRPAAAVDYRFDYIWGTRGLDDLIARDKYLPEDPVNKPSERLFALADATGNIRATTFGGASLAEFDYEPYGQFANTPTLGDWRHLFGGYYFDKSSGLYLVRNRVYHPQLGRWLQMDPLGMQAGLNGYEYCNGDPIDLTDPTGEFPFLLLLLAAGILAGAIHGELSVRAADPNAPAWEHALGITVGGLFGWASPWTAIGSLTGGLIGYAVDRSDPWRGYQIGGLIGGVFGGLGQSVQMGLQIGNLRAGLVAGGQALAWDASWMATGAGAGYLWSGTWQAR